MSGPVAASVYKDCVMKQSDIGNHNPRVGGSSPSSATNKSSTYRLSAKGNSERFTKPCKPQVRARGYDYRYLSRKFGLTTAQAVALIRQHGDDRAALNQAGADLARRARA